MTDVFVFECDLDRNQPEEQRAGLQIHDDGQHIVFGLARSSMDAREIYLDPGDAANLAALLIALTIEDYDEEPRKRFWQRPWRR